MGISPITMNRWLSLVAATMLGCGLQSSGTNDQRSKEFCKNPSSLRLMDTSGNSLDTANLAALCSNVGAFVCELRRFRPGLSTQEGEASFCATLQDDNEICSTATERLFDTSGARGQDNHREFERGGSYNYDEATCYHPDIRMTDSLGERAAVSARASTLPEALLAAYQLCSQVHDKKMGKGDPQ